MKDSLFRTDQQKPTLLHENLLEAHQRNDAHDDDFTRADGSPIGTNVISN
jgi:hypothetical protein